MSVAVDWPQQRFTEAQKALGEPGWLLDLRRAAFSRFSKLGFPTPEDEDWRFTRIDPIRSTDFALAAPGARLDDLASRSLLWNADAHRLVFVNGLWSRRLSSSAGLPAGATLCGLAELLRHDPEALRSRLGGGVADAASFPALNTAFFSDGAVLLLPRDAELPKPVHLLFLSSGESPLMAHSRVVIAAAPGSRASVVEEHLGEGVYFNNVLTDVALGDGASLCHYKVQRESDRAYQVSGLRARLAQDSRLDAHSFFMGGALVRNDVRATLEAPGAECLLNGLYLAGGRQHVDNHTVIEHKAAQGSSRELYKGVLDGHARAVFNGSIVVEPAAQKTSAVVYNKNLLLSEHGLVNTKPEFKIHANDVQCRHGATIGQLSADALFYLRSRGIDERDARALLIYAFASEMVERAGLPALREALAGVLSRWLPGEEA